MQEITVHELKQWQDEGKNFQLIDIREEYEYDACNLNGTLIPMGEIIDRIDEIAKDKPVVLHCRSGSRSAAIYQVLNTQYGFTNIFNLKGGIKAYSQEIDSTLNVI